MTDVFSPALATLKSHAETLANMDMRAAFAADPGRFARHSPTLDDLLIDWSKCRVTDETLPLLFDLARAAKVRIQGDAKDELARGLLLNDGVAGLDDNSGRLVHRGALPHVFEFTWDAPIELGAARVISGYSQDGSITAPLADFELQWLDGETWRPALLPTRTNTHPAWSRTFAPIRAEKLRLVVTKTKDDVSRIWEVELYGPVSASAQADDRGGARR